MRLSSAGLISTKLQQMFALMRIGEYPFLPFIFHRSLDLYCVFSHQSVLTLGFFDRRGNCKKASVGLQCEIGLRCRTYYVLCGSVLSVWTKVEGVLASVSGSNMKMQIVRLKTEDGQRIVGE